MDMKIGFLPDELEEQVFKIQPLEQKFHIHEHPSAYPPQCPRSTTKSLATRKIALISQHNLGWFHSSKSLSHSCLKQLQRARIHPNPNAWYAEHMVTIAKSRNPFSPPS
jgi:hypothetical protein